MTLARNMARLALREAALTATQRHATTRDAMSQSDLHWTNETISQVYDRLLRVAQGQGHSSPRYYRRPEPVNCWTWVDEAGDLHGGEAISSHNPCAEIPVDIRGTREMYDGPMPKVGDQIAYISWSTPYTVTRVDNTTKEVWISNTAGGSDYRYSMSIHFKIFPKKKVKVGFAKFVNDHGL